MRKQSLKLAVALKRAAEWNLTVVRDAWFYASCEAVLRQDESPYRITLPPATASAPGDPNNAGSNAAPARKQGALTDVSNSTGKHSSRARQGAGSADGAAAPLCDSASPGNEPAHLRTASGCEPLVGTSPADPAHEHGAGNAGNAGNEHWSGVANTSAAGGPAGGGPRRSLAGTPVPTAEQSTVLAALTAKWVDSGNAAQETPPKRATSADLPAGSISIGYEAPEVSVTIGGAIRTDGAAVSQQQRRGARAHDHMHDDSSSDESNGATSPLSQVVRAPDGRLARMDGRALGAGLPAMRAVCAVLEEGDGLEEEGACVQDNHPVESTGAKAVWQRSFVF